LEPGTYARVDVAPWLDSDEPEAALAASAASMERDYTSSGERPADVVFEPIGVRVRIVRALAGSAVVRVRGTDGHFDAYTRVDRLLPEVPPGTTLIAAGGFEGFADFFPRLSTRVHDAERLPTGTTLVALGLGAAPYDPDTADLVRVRVRIAAGPMRGRVGWVAAAYTGIPAARTSLRTAAERACGCRLVTFDD
jgi:hypothetical protein